MPMCKTRTPRSTAGRRLRSGEAVRDLDDAHHVFVEIPSRPDEEEGLKARCHYRSAKVDNVVYCLEDDVYVKAQSTLGRSPRHSCDPVGLYRFRSPSRVERGWTLFAVAVEVERRARHVVRDPWTSRSSGACSTSSPSSAPATTALILEQQADAPRNKHELRSQQRAIKRFRLLQKEPAKGNQKVSSVAEDIFMQKLRLAAEKKIRATKAEFFCKAFEEAHEKLVYKELSVDAAEKFLNAKKFQ